jgi:FkbM family methyltransferase
MSTNQPELYSISGAPAELPNGGRGAMVFDATDALEINRARLDHLALLDLPLSGRSVLDVGCGVGHLTPFFLERECRVTCVDGRAENIEILKKRLLGVPAHVMRVESDPLTRLGRFDLVFCYGLLHHLENPLAALRNLASVSNDLLLLETLVSDHELPLQRLLDEPVSTQDPALEGMGSRPTPSFVATALARVGFPYVYVPVTNPEHRDFQFDRLGNLDCARDNHPLRCMFVAARSEIENPQLRLLLRAPDARPAYFLPPAGVSATRVWLDVGAHLGEKTFAEAENDPNLRVYAFEPNLRLASQRMGRLANFVVVPMAVAETDGSAQFHLNDCDEASSLPPFDEHVLAERAGKEELRVDRTVAVPAIRLDSFLDQAGIERVDFLKIEAQGADLAVIKSCGSRLRDIARIELGAQITDRPLYSGAASRDEIVAFLETAGFELESSEAPGRGREENLVFIPALDIRPEELLAEARALSRTRALEPRPGYHFGIDWNRSDPLLQRRRRIWSHCQRRRIELPLPFDWLEGIKPTLYLGNDTSRALFVEGAIDPNEFVTLDRLLKPGMVMVDAGANEGLYTLFAAKRVGEHGRVLAFEPSARDRERLLVNIEQNGLSNVTVSAAALSDRAGFATLRIAVDDHSGQNTLGAFAYSGVGLLRQERVPVCTLDEVVAQSGIGRLDLLKLDVEGAETGVLRGAAASIRAYRPVMMVEVSDESLRKQSSSAAQLLQLVGSFGYVWFVFDADTGLPRPAAGEITPNMIAVPQEKATLITMFRDEPGLGKDVDFQPLSGSAAPFDLNRRLLCNDSQASGSGPVIITTAATQWSYAVGFRISEEARRELNRCGEFFVEVIGDVEAGQVGIGILNGDLSGYLAPEKEFEAAHAVRWELKASYLPAGAMIMIRNTSASGKPSKVVIRSLTVCTRGSGSRRGRGIARAIASFVGSAFRQATRGRIPKNQA